jgi:small-conductance mechanosensitive channel
MSDAAYQAGEGSRKRIIKEEKTMKTTISRKTAYIGAGAGLVLFALFGLMPGSLLGGAAGLNIAGWLFGLPVQPGLLSRIIVLASMLFGVLVAGIVIVTTASTVGWLVGKVLESGMHAKESAGDEAKTSHQ